METDYADKTGHVTFAVAEHYSQGDEWFLPGSSLTLRVRAGAVSSYQTHGWEKVGLCPKAAMAGLKEYNGAQETEVHA